MVLLVQDMAHWKWAVGAEQQAREPGVAGPLGRMRGGGRRGVVPISEQVPAFAEGGRPNDSMGWEWAPMIPVVTHGFGLKGRDARRVPTRISNGGGNHRVEQDVPGLISEPLMPVPVWFGLVWGIITVIKLPF